MSEWWISTTSATTHSVLFLVASVVFLLIDVPEIQEKLLPRWEWGHRHVGPLLSKIRWPRALNKILAFTLLWLAMVNAYHDLRLSGKQKVLSGEQEVRDLTQDMESLSTHVSILDREREELRQERDELREVRSLLSAKISELEGEIRSPRWVVAGNPDTAITGSTRVPDGTQVKVKRIYIIPGSQSISPAVIKVRCDCDLDSIELKFFADSALMIVQDPPILMDNNRVVKFKVSSPVISDQLLLRVLLGSLTPIRNVRVSIESG